MKKSTILIPLAALALSGCVFTPSKPSSGTTGGNPTSQEPGPGDSGTPQPGTSDSSGGGGGGGTTDTGGTSVTPTPTGHGTTKEDPLTPQEAIAKCDAAGAGVVVDNFEYFVGGLFDSGTSVNTEHHQWYGNLNGTGFKISGATNDSGVTVDEVNGAMDGKTVVVKGFIELYNNEYKMGYLPASASPTGEKYVPSIVSISSEPAQDAVLNVAINGGNQSVAADGSLTLSATVTVSGSAAKTVSWSSSNSGVATIDASSGVVSPVAEGKTTIRATSTVDSTKYDEIELTVVPAGSIEHGTTIGDPLTPAEAKALCDDAGDGKIPGPNKEYFVKGEVENAALNSNRYDADFVGTVFKLNSANNDSGVTLANPSALNNKIVTAKGYIELYQGTYKMGYLPASASPTGAKYNPSIVAIEEKSVTPGITSVTVTPSSVTKYTGDADFQLTAAVVAVGGAAETVSWSVSEGSSVVSVSSSGLVHILSAGSAKVRATSTVDSSKYAECAVTVTQSAATGVTVSPNNIDVQVNGTKDFSAVVAGVGNFTQAVTWSVDPSGAGSIDSNGHFTAGAAAASDVHIVATSQYTGTVSGFATIQITAEPVVVTVDSVTVSAAGGATSVETGQTLQFSAVVAGTNNTQGVTWEVVTSGAGTIDENGLFTAGLTAMNPVVIRATSKDDTSVHGDYSISVVEPAHVNTVQLAYEATKAASGTTSSMTFEGVVTGVIGNSFYVQDGNYGIYVYNHEVSGIAAGKMISVTATLKDYGGLVETDAVSAATLGSDGSLPTSQLISSKTELQASNTGIMVKANALVAKEAGPANLSSNANLKFDFAGEEVVVAFSKYESTAWATFVSNIAIGDVFDLDNVAVGSYNGTHQFIVSKTSSVTENTSPRVTSISIDGGDQSVAVDNTSFVLSATVNAINGASQAHTWASSDSGVATINSTSGAVTPVAEGTTTITVTSTYDSTKTASITLTVVAAGSHTTETSAYKLDGTITKSGSGSSAGKYTAYDQASDVTQSTITWDVYANTTMDPWRVGGKSLSAVDRLVKSTMAVSAHDISKVVVTLGNANITINSVTLYVGTSAGAKNTAEITKTSVSANDELVFEKTSGDWSSKYFTIVFNLTETTGSNKYVQLSAVEFFYMA